ncbi:MAG: hypothetical protein IJO78_03170 [Erysipelotrichaceae bacterium]|nr:hypothetical protein [Erysipelotrichaceae bacterium]
MIMTKMMKNYLVKLFLRISVFVIVFGMYIYDKELLISLAMQPLYMGITSMHVLWLVFMLMMLKHLFPKEQVTMALLKREEKKYVEVEGYSKLELLEFVQDQNQKAWRVMLVWLIGNGLVGLVYSMNWIGQAELFLLTVFYFLCDYICILFYCPFQSHIMKNRCCVNCRIYDWGHFMMFTPMIMIKSFYTWSLFFMACIVLIHWELVYAKHPERFYFGSNKRLQCANCKDKTCQIKRKVTGKAG